MGRSVVGRTALRVAGALSLVVVWGCQSPPKNEKNEKPATATPQFPAPLSNASAMSAPAMGGGPGDTMAAFRSAPLAPAPMNVGAAYNAADFGRPAPPGGGPGGNPPGGNPPGGTLGGGGNREIEGWLSNRVTMIEQDQNGTRIRNAMVLCPNNLFVFFIGVTQPGAQEVTGLAAGNWYAEGQDNKVFVHLNVRESKIPDLPQKIVVVLSVDEQRRPMMNGLPAVIADATNDCVQCFGRGG